MIEVKGKIIRAAFPTLCANRLRHRHVVGAARVAAHHRGLDAGELRRAHSS